MNTIMLDELDREQLLDLLDAVGGSSVDLDAIDDLSPILINTIGRVTDRAKVDRALNQPLTFEWRAALVTRRGELDQVAAAAPRQAAVFRGMVANVPDNLRDMTHFIGIDGSAREVRTENGRRVLDCSPGEYRQVLLTGPFGLDWENANQDGDARRHSGIHI